MAETESKSELKWGSELEEGKVRRGLGRDAHLQPAGHRGHPMYPTPHAAGVFSCRAQAGRC